MQRQYIYDEIIDTDRKDGTYHVKIKELFYLWVALKKFRFREFNITRLKGQF